MYLYKYRNFSLNHIQAITNNELWFSVGSTFNDPFDSQPPMNLFSAESVREFVAEASAFSSLNSVDINSLVENYLDSQERSLSESWINLENIIAHIAKITYIHCFSKTKESILMWSHYADHHKGFCVRFKLEELLPCVDLFAHKSVQYENTINNVLHMLTSVQSLDANKKISISTIKSAITLILIQKSTEWIKEEEYRFILNEFSENNNKYKPIVHPSNAVDGIFFGMKSTDRDRKFLFESLRGRDIEFFVMDRHKSDFKLESKPYVPV